MLKRSRLLLDTTIHTITLNAIRADTHKLRITCTNVTSLRFTDTSKGDVLPSFKYFVYGEIKDTEEKGQRVYTNLHINNFESQRVWLGPSCLDGAQKKPWSKMTNESFEDAPSHKPVTTYEHPCELLLHVSRSILSGPPARKRNNKWTSGWFIVLNSSEESPFFFLWKALTVSSHTILIYFLILDCSNEYLTANTFVNVASRRIKLLAPSLGINVD